MRSEELDTRVSEVLTLEETCSCGASFKGEAGTQAAMGMLRMKEQEFRERHLACDRKREQEAFPQISTSALTPEFYKELIELLGTNENLAERIVEVLINQRLDISVESTSGKDIILRVVPKGTQFAWQQVQATGVSAMAGGGGGAVTMSGGGGGGSGGSASAIVQPDLAQAAGLPNTEHLAERIEAERRKESALQKAAHDAETRAMGVEGMYAAKREDDRAKELREMRPKRRKVRKIGGDR